MFKLTRVFETGKPRSRGIFFLALALIILVPMQATAGNIKVSWNPAQVRSGGVVMMKVQSPVRLMAAEAQTGEDRFPLFKMEGGAYAALVGVDVALKEPSMPVDFVLFPAKGGPPYRIRADLKIKDGASGAKRTQNLSLPTGMVDLSQKRVKQVQKDNRNLGDILATRSRERYWKEGFLLPLQGRITTRFGTGRVLNGKPRSSHSGVDISGKKGKPVKASNSGKVLLADDFYLSGKTVVVDHGWGVSTLYAHLDRIDVQEGQEMNRGQVLGTVGTTGRSTGPHLHFGAFIRGSKIDPLLLVEVTKQLSTR
ncbi:MAG: M23 family metallopeptidase [bacterium]|nr:M23 family metallopeptidase [bacterium]MDT8365472.1 M23 family metallopeptidase [bacterium]